MNELVPAMPERRDLSDGVVLLRAPRAADVPALVSGCSDPQVARWTSAIPVPYTPADGAWFVANAAEAWTLGTATNFAVAEADAPERLLGVCGLHALDRTGEPGGAAEIGYWLAPEGRGRGVMTRAVRLLCSWAVGELRLARITWWAVAGNEASRAVAERAGFGYEGLVRRGLLHRGVRVDGWVAGLLPEDLADRLTARPGAR